MSDAQRKQQLEDYLYGRMGAEAERAFLNRMEKNLRMQETLAAYRLSGDAPATAASRLKMLREKFGGPDPNNWGLLQPHWAAIWGLIGLIVFLVWNIAFGYLNYTDEALAKAYYLPATELPEPAPMIFQQSDSLFYKGQYQEVIELLREGGRSRMLTQDVYVRTALWNSLLAKLAAGEEEQGLRRLLRNWQEEAGYPADFREKAANLERDLSSIYHQLIAG